jgi:hypothetical protein
MKEREGGTCDKKRTSRRGVVGGAWVSQPRSMFHIVRKFEDLRAKFEEGRCVLQPGVARVSACARDLVHASRCSQRALVHV